MFVRNKKFFIVLILCVGLAELGFFLFQSNFVQNNRFYRAWKYEQMAKKFPPTSEMYLRLKAMADALRHNQSTYSYEIDHPSFMGPMPPVPTATSSDSFQSPQP